MPRSMWRGAISFGMVAIPVRLYLATESKSVSFRMLCPDCHTPIRNRRWCPNEDKEIPWSSTIRGFEVGKDAFRDREHLCRLALHERGLLLNTLHWPDEIRDAGELALPEADTRPEI